MPQASDTVKLSSPTTKEFWEIPVVYEDEHLLALNKPANLLTSPDRENPDRPNLMKLLHRGIEKGAPWAVQRNLTYLFNAHRLDAETTGVILLAKSKPVLVSLANFFGSEKPNKIYAALVKGVPTADEFSTEAKLAPHPVKPGLMQVDPKNGKRSRTEFKIRERFKGFTLLECRPLPGRTHQVRVHLACLKLPVLGDRLYGGSELLLSTLKRDFRLKRNRTERPLISSLALHAEELYFPHPITGNEVKITAEMPKDLKVALKYLRLHAADSSPLI